MFSLNPAARIFAIGDVHGCSRELAALLKKIDPRPQDTVVFLGDYIDRGPDSRGVVDLVLALKKRCKVVALKGNHEELFIDFLESPESANAGLFILNGGSSTLASYAGPGGTFEIPESHVQFFYDLKLFYETNEYFFVHAGVPLKSLKLIDEKEDAHALMWSRQPFLSSSYKWEKIVVHGHTPVNDVEVLKNRINVDTGCVYDGELTAIELPRMKIHSVSRGAKGEPINIPLRDLGEVRVAVRFTGRLRVEAAREGEPPYEFETLNYNQFGLLMQDVGPRTRETFQVDDVITGRIGSGPSAINFTGTVARIEARADSRLYGVRIDRVTNGNEGREWIERPPGS